MDYRFSEIERFAAQKWAEHNIYKVENNSPKPKFYVLDMFPYPSGAGLHVGHPLGYIASDIFSRYKRLNGFNVLHPMGFDSFGLPAEQYAIQTGQHPAKTTKDNIARYKEQLAKIGFSYDWSREVVTSEPNYYKWTQWIFIQLFNSWYDKNADKARFITELEEIFRQNGNTTVKAACSENTPTFTAEEWNGFSEKEKSECLMHYRLAYLADSWVNWCEALGTVLANDEVVNGVSERGGHPVEKKKMSQWFLRITAYAERLLKGLETLEWSDSMKEMQRNWIGKSKGAMVSFAMKGHDFNIDVFTTRVDTIFGVTFLVIAPEHDFVKMITTDECAADVDAYVKRAASKSDIERQAEAKETSGQFTGAYVIHPFTGEEVPVFIADYVLAGYGTGAVMAVPSGDQRDYLFAKKYHLPIIPILDAQKDLEHQADPTKEGTYINSEFINGKDYATATQMLIDALEQRGIGYGKIQFRMRDAGFSRQRYWGEPFPVYYENEIPKLLDIQHLPLELPEVASYKPAGNGESPLSTAKDWVQALGEGKTRETDTMPAFAGSSWYFLRYMDPDNKDFFVSKEAQTYWQDVDLYIGGTEHAVGHLLYSRFWHKFFKDNGWVSTEEPFKKLVNQGMIGGVSKKIFYYNFMDGKEKLNQNDVYFSEDLFKIFSPDNSTNSGGGSNAVENYLINYKGFTQQQIIELFNLKSKPVYSSISPIYVDIKYVNGNELDVKRLKKECSQFANANFITNKSDVFLCVSENEKMSKSKLNVVNPDDVIAEFGADCFRMFEMFLGPIEQHKPWDTQGIGGVSKFLAKLWRLFAMDEQGHPHFSDGSPDKDALKTVHKAIKKVTEDIERFSFNTAVSAFMICVNDLSKNKTNHKDVLEPLVVLLAPFAPFTAEALWEKLGHNGCIAAEGVWPTFNPTYLVENTVNYPISINGKVRAKLDIAAQATPKEVEEIVMKDDIVVKWLEGNTPKKVIVVPGRIVNIVL
ncbi:MAG: leucine--tRNA ligase [Chitinophagales bacterium]|nr:leucine--tRNA ligase [Chitinophagales bacterium]